MKNHMMYLTPSPFKKIKEGHKTIELRLYDEKRKMISVGDTITFTNTVDSNILFKRNAAIVWCCWYKNFSYIN